MLRLTAFFEDRHLPVTTVDHLASTASTEYEHETVEAQVLRLGRGFNPRCMDIPFLAIIYDPDAST
jgi:hypothetical protein